MRLGPSILALMLTGVPLSVVAEPIPASVLTDPSPDKAHPASMVAIALPTKGVKINAVLYTAAGAGPHPTVLLLHGLPGNEQNLDLAQAVRREGWNVLTLHYRGSWGSPGQFSFGHCMEDAQAALAWLRDPNTAQAAQIDAGKIVVMGHSTGGFMAAFAASHDEGLLGVALISPGGPGRIGLLKREQAIKVIDDNIGTTAGMRTVNTSPEALADEAIRNASDWNITAWGPGLAKHPLLIVSANDGLAPANEALRDSAANGQPVTYLHLDTDHSYSDHRIALEAAVIRWLENLPGAPAGL